MKIKWAIPRNYNNILKFLLIINYVVLNVNQWFSFFPILKSYSLLLCFALFRAFSFLLHFFYQEIRFYIFPLQFNHFVDHIFFIFCLFVWLVGRSTFVNAMQWFWSALETIDLGTNWSNKNSTILINIYKLC